MRIVKRIFCRISYKKKEFQFIFFLPNSIEHFSVRHYATSIVDTSIPANAAKSSLRPRKADDLHVIPGDLDGSLGHLAHLRQWFEGRGEEQGSDWWLLEVTGMSSEEVENIQWALKTLNIIYIEL